jgi:nitrite reductase/ring-hydroxylating ferredoxin subunit
LADLARNLHKLCSSKSLTESSNGLRFFVRIENEVRPAFVVRYAGEPRAYLNECAHQAVELDMLRGNFFDRSGKFLICATHGAMYNPATGECASGRCDGRSLRSLTVIEFQENICFAAESGIDFESLEQM